MKLALISEQFQPQRGGAERSAVELAAALCREGIEVTVLARSLPPEAAAVDCRMERLAVSGWTRLEQWLSFRRAVERMCGPRRFDIVHSLAPIPAADLYQPRGGSILYSSRRSRQMANGAIRARLKSYTAPLNVARQLRIRAERHLCLRPDGPLVLALSGYVQHQFQEEYPAVGPRLRLVPNGIDTAAFRDPRARREGLLLRQRFDPGGDRTIFLFAAENFHLKGLRRLVEAAGLLGRRGGVGRDFLILVAGRENYRPYFHMARRLGLAGRVVFLGSTRRMSALANLADAVVLPTYNDACSRLVLEALAAGRPAITTRFNGAADFLGEGRYGIILADPDDAEALADALAQGCDAGRRREWSRAIEADRVHERVSLRRHVAELLGVYEEILRGRPGRGAKT
ncbi:MAG: glycosyltransferase family 4 protein [Sedimentisphaerales bacterium]|nr:glycosyltransferase family 4 protein [Sedimentisphaerales bacterium]